MLSLVFASYSVVSSQFDPSVQGDAVSWAAVRAYSPKITAANNSPKFTFGVLP